MKGNKRVCVGTAQLHESPFRRKGSETFSAFNSASHDSGALHRNEFGTLKQHFLSHFLLLPAKSCQGDFLHFKEQMIAISGCVCGILSFLEHLSESSSSLD